MQEEKNHIDKLFKSKLEGFVSPVPEDIWDNIDDAMPKKLFFRFRFEHMNIYYCSLIVVCFLFSTVSLVYTLSDRGIDGSKRSLSTVPLVDSVTHNDKPSSSFEKKTSSFERRKLQQEKVNVYSASSVLEKGTGNISLPSDSSHQVIAKERTDSLAESKVSKSNSTLPAKKIKKIVYVTDYDTILKIDTLRTKKKRR